jgi:hypothetical protein
MSSLFVGEGCSSSRSFADKLQSRCKPSYRVVPSLIYVRTFSWSLASLLPRDWAAVDAPWVNMIHNRFTLLGSCRALTPSAADLQLALGHGRGEHAPRLAASGTISSRTNDM